jgi:hypothetical protein
MLTRSIVCHSATRRLAVPATRNFSRKTPFRLEESLHGTQASATAEAVPIVPYHDRLRADHQLYFTPPAEGAPASALPPEDVKRRAQALKTEYITRLTPTLQKFTIAGRVAVITGCVYSMLWVPMTNALVF